MTEGRRLRRHLAAAYVAVVVLALSVTLGVLWNRPPADLDGEWWLVVSSPGDGASIWDPLTGAMPTLTIRAESGHRVGSATAGCNTSSGAFTYTLGGRLTLDDWATTTVGCREPLGEVEAAYLLALASVDHVEVDEDELLLTGDDVRLMFRRLDSPSDTAAGSVPPNGTSRESFGGRSKAHLVDAVRGLGRGVPLELELLDQP